MNFSGIDVDLHGVFQDNTTYDYPDDYEYKPEIESVEGSATWIPVVYSLITIVGLLGNGLVLVFLARKWRAWRMSDTFVLHLCLVDVLLLLTLPLWAAQATRRCGWCFGIPLCRFVGAVFNMNYYFGFLLLICISLDLHQSIIHSKRLFLLNTPRNAHISCLVAWLVSLVLTVPDLGATEVHKDPMVEDRALCFPNFYLPNWQQSSRMVHHILSFAAVLVVCCAGGLLWVQQSAKTLVRRRSVVIIHVLAVVFILCWIPYNIVLLVDTSRSRDKDPQESGSSLSKSLAATAAFGCLHACLRPLLYLSLCTNFRNQASAMLQCKKVEFQGSLWEMGIAEGPLVSHNVNKEELKQITTVEGQGKSIQC